LPTQKKDTLDLLRKAAISVQAQRVTSESAPVLKLVGEVAAYVKPVPRQEQPQGGGRSQGANAQRKRAVRSDDSCAPRRDRSGRPARSGSGAPASGDAVRSGGRSGQGRPARAGSGSGSHAPRTRSGGGSATTF